MDNQPEADGGAATTIPAKRQERERRRALRDERGERGYPPGWETATFETRHAPDYVIIGTQRGGTTSLYRYLEEHPDCGEAWRKEVHFFDRHYDRGLQYYLAHFPERGKHQIVGEATPYYLYDPRAPARLHEALPNAKLIVLLRDPVARAYSQYQLEQRRGDELLSFEEAIAAEPARMAAAPDYSSDDHRHYSYLTRGRYAEQLARWFAVVPREQFMIIKSEEFYADPRATLHDIEAWLGLPAWAPATLKAYNAREYDALAPALRHQLTEYYRPFNAMLYELIDRDLGW